MDASYKIQRGIHVHLIQFFMCPEFWVHIKSAPRGSVFNPYNTLLYVVKITILHFLRKVNSFFDIFPHKIGKNGGLISENHALI